MKRITMNHGVAKKPKKVTLNKTNTVKPDFVLPGEKAKQEVWGGGEASDSIPQNHSLPFFFPEEKIPELFTNPIKKRNALSWELSVALMGFRKKKIPEVFSYFFFIFKKFLCILF